MTMNLRHIDEFLERYSAGWNPFKGDFRISKGSFRRNPLREMFGGDTLLADLGNTFAGAVGYETPWARRSREEEERNAQAEAEAAVKQAEFEASTRAGLEKLALKRRRGFGASMIVQPTLGSTMTLGS